MYWVEEPILHTSLRFIRGGTHEQALAELKHLGVKEDRLKEMTGDARKGFCWDCQPDDHEKGMSFRMIWVKDNSLATLVHEITHLVMFTFDSAGIPIREVNSEIFAYHMEFWFNKLRQLK